jgi:hypothetical protein
VSAQDRLESPDRGSGFASRFSVTGLSVKRISVSPAVADAQEWTRKPGRPLQVKALAPKTIGSNRVQTSRSVILAGMAHKAESHWGSTELAVEAAQVALHPPSLLLVVPGDGRRGSILRWSLEHSCGGPINLAELIRRLRSEARAAG